LALTCRVRRRRRSTLFPYTTLFRSRRRGEPGEELGVGGSPPLQPVRVVATSDIDACHEPDRGAGRYGERALITDVHDLESLSGRSEEHTSELQSRENLVCRLLLEKK